ncbi:MAG TPA: hypothetical protein VGF32_24045, partial [Streptosporangiaceae bacterium]
EYGTGPPLQPGSGWPFMMFVAYCTITLPLAVGAGVAHDRLVSALPRKAEPPKAKTPPPVPASQ